VIATYPVKSPGRPYQPMGKALEACWTEPGLSDEYADVLAWRDGVLRNAEQRTTERAQRV
jgi:hypothetical protein